MKLGGKDQLIGWIVALLFLCWSCQPASHQAEAPTQADAKPQELVSAAIPSENQTLVQVTVYYRHVENLGLLPVQKEIFRHAKEADMVKQVIDHLSIEPYHPDAEAIWLMSTYVREVFLAGEGEIVIDFNGEFIQSFSAGVEQEELMLASLVNSVLDNFPAFTQVRILVDGTMQESFLGHLDTELPLVRRERIPTVIPEGMDDDSIAVENLDTAKIETP